jgi:hypothetical protein
VYDSPHNLRNKIVGFAPPLRRSKFSHHDPFSVSLFSLSLSLSLSLSDTHTTRATSSHRSPLTNNFCYLIDRKLVQSKTFMVYTVQELLKLEVLNTGFSKETPPGTNFSIK